MAEATKASLYEELTDWSNLLAAARKARRGKRRQPVVAAFEYNRESELLNLQAELRSRTYRPGTYQAFTIHDPKTRLISAAPYRDRIVHHALVNVIQPLFERNFIADSFANRIGKGTHRAVDRFQFFARRHRFVLQCDIVKFFPSVDHQILKQLLRSRIRDEHTLWLCDTIIDGSNPQEPVTQYFPGDDLFSPSTRRRGLPIGNMTSQFWANVYLHGLDNFVKRGLRCPGYVRYVDDFALFADGRADLWRMRDALMRYLETLRLRIHIARAQVHPVERPRRFLGYRVWPTHRYLTRENLRRFRRRARSFQRRYRLGQMSWADIRTRLNSWNAHAATADSLALRRRLFASLPFKRGPIDPTASCAAAPGTTTRGTAAPPIATGTRPATATTTSGSGSCRGVSPS